MKPVSLNIIIFCDKPNYGGNANTIIEHIDAFPAYSRHNIFVFSNRGKYPPNLDLTFFDVVIIHYSSTLLNYNYISKEGQDNIKAFQGLKVMFIQDEYREINYIKSRIKDLEIDVLYTCFPPHEIEKVYPKDELPKLLKINNLTGYVPEKLQNVAKVPITERKIDVGYRARKLSYYYGTLGAEKWMIADKFIKYTRDDNLRLDISYEEKDRIYGDKWLKFISSCKTMLGVESGASVMDFTGNIATEVQQYESDNPSATFEEVHQKFLLGLDGLISLNQISPRCFEAMALRCALVLYEGEYSGILKPGQHYIELKKDFSNIHSVVSMIKDNHCLQEITNKAYEEIIINPAYSYATFIKSVDDVIEREFINRDKLMLKSTVLNTDKNGENNLNNKAEETYSTTADSAEQQLLESVSSNSKPTINKDNKSNRRFKRESKYNIVFRKMRLFFYYNILLSVWHVFPRSIRESLLPPVIRKYITNFILSKEQQIIYPEAMSQSLLDKFAKINKKSALEQLYFFIYYRMKDKIRHILPDNLKKKLRYLRKLQ